MPEMDKTDEVILGVARKQEEHIIDEVATALIGVGALFFAYASLRSSPIAPFIALIGAGGSAFIWLHLSTANLERDAAFDYLRARDTFKPYQEALDKLSKWRDSGWFRAYVPVTAAATVFMGLITVIWLWILITNSLFPIPATRPAYLLIVTLVFVGSYAFLLVIGARRRARRRGNSTHPRTIGP